MLLSEFREKYKKDILHLSSKHHIKKVKIFGSLAKGCATPKSDIDLLVTLDKQADLMDLGGFYHDVSQLIPQHKIDIVTENSIHWYIRNDVLNEAQVL